MSAYKITLDNGVWYVIESRISNPEEFIHRLYNSGDSIHIFSIIDKSLVSNTNTVAFDVGKICSIEWKGVSM